MNFYRIFILQSTHLSHFQPNWVLHDQTFEKKEEVATVVSKPGSYCKLAISDSHSIYAIMWAVLPELDNNFSLNDKQRTAITVFYLLLTWQANFNFKNCSSSRLSMGKLEVMCCYHFPVTLQFLFFEGACLSKHFLGTLDGCVKKISWICDSVFHVWLTAQCTDIPVHASVNWAARGGRYSWGLLFFLSFNYSIICHFSVEPTWPDSHPTLSGRTEDEENEGGHKEDQDTWEKKRRMGKIGEKRRRGSFGASDCGRHICVVTLLQL